MQVRRDRVLSIIFAVGVTFSSTREERKTTTAVSQVKHRSGKEVEKFLKMCNRRQAGVGSWNGSVQFIIKKLAGPFQLG